MTVYVDEWFNYGVRVSDLGPEWCHLTADTLEELHTFAASIGLSRKVFHDGKIFKYYNVGALQIREQAIAQEAEEIHIHALLGSSLVLGGDHSKNYPAIENILERAVKERQSWRIGGDRPDRGGGDGPPDRGGGRVEGGGVTERARWEPQELEDITEASTDLYRVWVEVL